MTILDNLKTCYEGPYDSLGADFIKPCLKECVLYRRETAWFRSSVIRAWGNSLVNIIENEQAKIEIIAYPQIDKSTKIALDKSLNDKNRDNILKKHRQNILLKVLNIDINSDVHNWETGKDIGQTLSYLIADEKLEIRFATCINYSDYQVVPDNADENTLTHGKRGYFNFKCNTTVSFNGSANESHAGLMTQGENFDVYDSREKNHSWKVDEHKEKIDATWSGERKGYKIEKVSRELLKKIKIVVKNHNEEKNNKLNVQNIKDSVQAENNELIDFEKEMLKENVWPHKIKAINIFLENQKGVLEMATGTGKTSTALQIARQLFLTKKIEKILICPNRTNTLCEQWYEEVMKWRKKRNLKTLNIRRFYDNHNEAGKFIDGSNELLIVNRMPNKLKDILKNIDRNKTLIIQDEVHGFGSKGMMQLEGLHKKFKYTLGLSATPIRKFDAEGSSFILNEMGDVIYEYRLEDAIGDGILCPFNYIHLPVALTKEERRKKQGYIAKLSAAKKGIGDPYSEKDYMRDMSDVNKLAKNKEPAFEDFISKNPNLVKANSIIFCHRKEQARLLGNYIHKYTSKFSYYFDEGVDRDNLMRIGSDLDCVISCHILSEGIDIPSLENIFILASDSDKRETIQRIGRCLRVDKNNPEKIANVVDFIVHSNEEPLKSEKERFEWLKEISKTRKKNG
jgi:superfamily II DNA or RNA helicase